MFEWLAIFVSGVNIGSYGLLIHCVSCSAFPILCRTFLKNFSTRSILFLAVLSSTLSIFIMVLVPTPPCMVLMSIFPGFLMGALMAIPFQLLTNYHDREEVRLLLFKGRNFLRLRHRVVDRKQNSSCQPSFFRIFEISRLIA